MPERNQADSEGITLPPAHLTRLIAREEANQVILQHLALCPFATEEVNARLRTLELRLSTLIGFMLGSGLLGGMSGALLTKLLQ